MHFEPLKAQDLPRVRMLNPEGWPDILPAHEMYLNSSICYPLKLVLNNKIIGLGTTIVHGFSAWLAHIIVNPENRNQGMGRKITETLLDQAYAHNCSNISLIATDLGAPVYEKLGFVTETEYAFYKLDEPLLAGNKSASIVRYSTKYFQSILQMDMEISGEKRKIHFESLLQNAYVYLSNNEILGYYIPQWGEGFIGAIDPNAGMALLEYRLQSKLNVVFPKNNTTAILQMQSFNIFIFRTAKRMYLGEPIPWKSEMVFQRIGGNLG